MIVIVMGVSGAGKSTVGRLLAERLGARFVEADDYHPAGNIAKMRAGKPLTHTDRLPWLLALASEIDETRKAGRDLVLACSALTRRYRDMLTRRQPDDVLVVHLVGTLGLIEERMLAREHFMAPPLLASQFETLEPPDADERPLTLDIRETPDVLVERIVDELRRRGESGG